MEPQRRANGLMLLVVTAVLIAAPNLSRAQAPPAEQGEEIYLNKCGSCHTVGEGDTPMGPDLAGVTERRDPEWLRRIIMEPDKLIAEGDPEALRLEEKYGMAMPDMGITQDQFQALVTYLAGAKQSENAPSEAAAKQKPKEATGGDAERGRALYVGTVRLENGGAPCLACHGIGGAGLGMAAGASYGTDLTSLHDNYGAQGVESILQSLPFPSMEPIYSTRPLTGDEQRDLAAFFAAIADKEPAQMEGNLALHAGGAVIALGLVFFLSGWNRLRSVRRSLLEKVEEKARRSSR